MRFDFAHISVIILTRSKAQTFVITKNWGVLRISAAYLRSQVPVLGIALVNFQSMGLTEEILCITRASRIIKQLVPDAIGCSIQATTSGCYGVAREARLKLLTFI